MAKRLNFTHNQRHAAFVAEMGEYPKTVPGDLLALSSELIGKDTPEMELDRKRDTFGILNLRENSPETYGQSIAQQQKKYGATVRMVARGVNCDVEMSEVESVVVKSTGHNYGKGADETENELD